MYEISPLFPGLPGGPELLIVLLVVVLLFGANRLPELARSSGRAIGEFQRGRQEIEAEIRNAAAETSTDDAVEEDDAETNATTATR